MGIRDQIAFCSPKFRLLSPDNDFNNRTLPSPPSVEPWLLTHQPSGKDVPRHRRR